MCLAEALRERKRKGEGGEEGVKGVVHLNLIKKEKTQIQLGTWRK